MCISGLPCSIQHTSEKQHDTAQVIHKSANLGTFPNQFGGHHLTSFQLKAYVDLSSPGVVIFNTFVCFRYCVFHTEEVCMSISLSRKFARSSGALMLIIYSSSLLLYSVCCMQYPILLKPHRILLATGYQRLGSTDTQTLFVSVPDEDNGALEALTNYYSVYNGQNTPFSPYDVCCTEQSQGLLCPVNVRCP